eukprot:g22923.t1
MFARISRHGSLGTNGAIAPRTVRDRTGLMAPWHGWSPGTRSSKLRACTRQVGGHKLPLQDIIELAADRPISVLRPNTCLEL